LRFTWTLTPDGRFSESKIEDLRFGDSERRITFGGSSNGRVTSSGNARHPKGGQGVTLREPQKEADTFDFAAGGVTFDFAAGGVTFTRHDRAN